LRDEEVFLFRLCLKLGIPHPDYLRGKINSRQIAEWIAFFNIEPFGTLHEELLAGQICSTVVNSRPFRKEGSNDVLATDFMPSYVPEPESWNIIRENVQLWKDISDDSQ